MSKTSFSVVNILYQYIAISDLLTGPKKVNGDVYLYQRPINSTKEDIVINSLPINRGDVQEGVLNVNIYVPNLVLTFDNVADNTHPNAERLTELAGIANEVLDYLQADDADYIFEAQQDNIESDVNAHYINVRVNFYSPNI